MGKFLNFLKYLPIVGEPAMAKFNTDASINAQKSMAEYSYSKDVEMWNKQNEYNSPLQQMARFKEAGLNPNLIYGQGSAGNATNLPRYQAPSPQYNYKSLNALPVLSAYQDVKQRMAQTDLIREQVNYTRNKTINEGLASALKNLLLTKGNIDLKYYDQNAYQRTQNLFNQGQLQIGQGVLQKYSGDYKKKLIDSFDTLNSLRVQQIQSQINQTRVNTDMTRKQLEMYDLGMISKAAPGLANVLKLFLSK